MKRQFSPALLKLILFHQSFSFYQNQFSKSQISKGVLPALAQWIFQGFSPVHFFTKSKICIRMEEKIMLDIRRDGMHDMCTDSEKLVICFQIISKMSFLWCRNVRNNILILELWIKYTLLYCAQYSRQRRKYWEL